MWWNDCNIGEILGVGVLDEDSVKTWQCRNDFDDMSDSTTSISSNEDPEWFVLMVDQDDEKQTEMSD